MMATSPTASPVTASPTPSPTTPAGLPGKPAVPGLELSPLQAKLNNDCGFEFSYVESELKNITTATFIDIKLVFQLYDKDDKKVDTATLNEKTLAPGGTLKFTAGADAITNAGVRAELIEIKASQQ